MVIKGEWSPHCRNHSSLRSSLPRGHSKGTCVVLSGGSWYTHPEQGGRVQRGARLGWAKDSSMDETEVSQLRKGLVNSGSCSPAVLPAHLQLVRRGWALVSAGGPAPSLLQWEGTFWEAALALGGTDERSHCHAGKSLLKRTFCFCREQPAFK